MSGDKMGKADHYNTHPSGIECIEITRGMSFDLGNAVKYAMRMHDHEDGTLSCLDKTRDYLLDHMRNGEAQRVGRFSPDVASMLRIVGQAEPLGSASRRFYFAMSDHHYGKALDEVEALIEFYTAASAT